MQPIASPNPTAFDISPLSKYPIFKADDIEEAQELIAKNFGPHSLNILKIKQQGLDSKYDGLFLDGVALLHSTYGADVLVKPQSDEYFFTQTTTSGHSRVLLGGQEVLTEKGFTAVISPSVDYQFRLLDNCSRLLVMFDRKTLEHHLSQLIDRELHEPLIFDLAMDTGTQNNYAWNRTLQHLCDQFNHSRLLLGYNAFLQQAADMLKSLLLEVQPHNYSHLLHSDPVIRSPRHVRRAIAYIKEHIDRPITLAEITAAVGVTARTLQKGFLKYTGASPSEYIRSLRTRLIHEELVKANAEHQVSEILLRYGVTSFGHFSKIYKDRYGCTPCETLKKRP